ncbi:MAG: sugar nucleotide-binding protein [Pirellulaceae bacterium]|jgi:dTDP-4-dehydrorhamnose reductase|nr:sugar nucleotide-binding protein [Pirellulaceae bacterium]
MVVEQLPPLPLLISGIAGVAGYNAFHYFRRRFPGQVIGTRRVDNWPLAGADVVPCDMHDRASVERLFDRYQFASILNCEGTCKLKSCELDPALAHRVNVVSVQHLLDQIQGTDVRLVHMSVDLVFSGTAGGGHVETDPTDPVTVYGRTMVEAEHVIAAERAQACVLRISLPMGISFNGHAGAIDWIQSRFRKSKPATLFFDEVRTPKYTDCLNLLCETLLANRLGGLYHAGGPRRLSLYEIAQIVNRVGGYEPRHLMGCYRHEAGPIPPRAGDVTMNSSKLVQALGYDPFDPWPLEDCWVPTHREWHCEREAGERGSAELLARVLYVNPARRAAGFGVNSPVATA